MNSHNIPAEILATLPSETPKEAAEYRTPELVEVGTATALIQGFWGRWYDGYPGHYTDRHG